MAQTILAPVKKRRSILSDNRNRDNSATLKTMDTIGSEQIQAASGACRRCNCRAFRGRPEDQFMSCVDCGHWNYEHNR